jgi:hypothetical protein
MFLEKKNVAASVTINPHNIGSNNKKSVVSQYLKHLHMLKKSMDHSMLQLKAFSWKHN